MKAALYARVSSEEQVEGYSIDAQRRAFAVLCESRQWTSHREYIEEGKSARTEDSEDFLHDLILAMARVKANYTAKGKELTEGGLVRLAQYELADYWRKHFKRINGIDCSRCSKAQREKCKDWDLLAIRLLTSITSSLHDLAD